MPNNLSQVREPQDDAAKGNEEIAEVHSEVPHGLLGFGKLAHHATASVHGTQTATSSSGIAPPFHPGKRSGLLGLDDPAKLALHVVRKDALYVLEPSQPGQRFG